jgi:deoxyhypusine synthase
MIDELANLVTNAERLRKIQEHLQHHIAARTVHVFTPDTASTILDASLRDWVLYWLRTNDGVDLVVTTTGKLNSFGLKVLSPCYKTNKTNILGVEVKRAPVGSTRCALPIINHWLDID